VRIIHGELSGRIPFIPKNLDARPTTDLARGALFNILLNRFDFDQLRVLDLFAGTGLISYEFASLGCRDITAVERDRFHCDAIRKNIDMLKLTGLRLVQTDVFRYLEKHPEPFDIIFADPPYDHPRIMLLPELVSKQGILKNNGTFILEHGPGLNFSEHQGFAESREYGKVHFSFFSY
jgi:16S rRNA (guanine(966)-N(2))-methyltransferase RsmD